MAKRMRNVLLTMAAALLFTSFVYGQHSLTKKPTNTADVAGSINITLECASTYGTDLILWSFTALRPPTTDTIYISSGYQLLETFQQKYALNATVNSSILIVRQLSSSTEGTYSCSDGEESASAFLLVIPFPISMEPLFGPVAGGTNITITGLSPSDYPPSNSGSYTPDIRDAITVYIGYDLLAKSVTLSETSSASKLVAITPNTTETSIGQPLPIIIEFSSALFNMAPFNMSFNTAFSYLPNPEITGIFIISGGELLNITGRSLSSVAKPIIQLKVVITRAADNSSTSTTTRRLCTVLPGQDTSMQCPTPPLNLPDDNLAILNSWYDTSSGRRKRSINPNDPDGALAVNGSNGTDQANLYLGFLLDGYPKYENISKSLPDVTFILILAPEIHSTDELIEFDPSVDEFIYVKGRGMTSGGNLHVEDYVVHIGNQPCKVSALNDSQLSCRPPKVKPSSTVNDTIYCGQYLSVTVTIRLSQCRCACLTYTTHSATDKVLGIGIGVGIGVGGILVVGGILLSVLCRRNELIKKTKIDDTGTGGKLNMGSEGRDNSSAAHYETLDAKLTSNSRPVYEQIKTATTIDVGQYNISEGATQENFYDRLSANETTESQDLQNIELPPSDEYETIVQ